LSHLGLDRALPETEMALQLDPASFRKRRAVVAALHWTGRWSESVARARNLGLGDLPLVRRAMLRLGQAAAVLRQVRAADPEGFPDWGDPFWTPTLGVAGEWEEAAFHARLYANGRPLAAGEPAHHDMYVLACAEAQLGHTAQAVAWLRKAAVSG